MISADIQNIVELLKTMAKAELTVAKLYMACAKVFTDEKDFWLKLTKQEEVHAKSLYKMYKIIINKPENFCKGRNFNVRAINTFIAGVENNIILLQKGELSKEKCLIIARDIEDALLENKICEVVKTDDMEYQTLSKLIESQTINHKNEISNKINI